MYIWILLATIMVALSFFNVAPRADKEHALNDIKAATIINRFNAEHSARLHTLECEIIYNRNTQKNGGGAGWDGADGMRTSSYAPVNVTGYEPVYLEFNTYLPVGYLTGNKKKDGSGGNYATGNMKQFVYCLSLSAEEDAGSKPDSEVFIACDAQDDARTKNIGDHRYLVSFAPIPERWLSKDGNLTPLPTFVNLLSNTSGRAASFGWLEYVDGKPKLHGVGAAATRAIRLREKSHTFDDDHKDQFEQRLDENYNYKADLSSKQAGHEKLVAENILISENSAIWRNSELDVCKTTPCMFAYEVFPKTDPACHCYNILEDYYGRDRLNLAQCYNDTKHTEIENNDKINVFTDETLKDRELRYKKFESYLK